MNWEEVVANFQVETGDDAYDQLAAELLTTVAAMAMLETRLNTLEQDLERIRLILPPVTGRTN